MDVCRSGVTRSFRPVGARPSRRSDRRRASIIIIIIITSSACPSTVACHLTGNISSVAPVDTNVQSSASVQALLSLVGAGAFRSTRHNVSSYLRTNFFHTEEPRRRRKAGERGGAAAKSVGREDEG